MILPCNKVKAEAPTYAKLLGIHLPDADGVCMDFLLK